MYILLNTTYGLTWAPFGIGQEGGNIASIISVVPCTVAAAPATYQRLKVN